jgi:hypothetical protein
MPFSRLYRRQPPFASDNDYDLNMPYNPDRWHEQELDFTSYSTLDQTTQHQVLSKPVPMDTDESQPAYLRPTATSKSLLDGSVTTEMFNTGPFAFSDLINMDTNTVSPQDISSSSSVRTEPLASLEASNRSPCFRASSGTALPTLQEKMCPLISGDVDTCEPSKCGPNAPCMNFSGLPPIEECASVPCISPPEETVPLINTANSPVTRSSARLRRPLTTKRSLTTMSSSSSEDRKPTLPATRRPPSTSRTTTTDRGPITKLDKKQRAKQAHSLVEKKYRENLNTKLSTLYTTLQNAQYGPRRFTDPENNSSDVDFVDDDAYDGGGGPQSQTQNSKRDAGLPAKFRKSEVLDDAMAYVNQTEVEMRHMEAELARLGERVRSLEKLVKCEDCSLLKRMVHLAT